MQKGVLAIETNDFKLLIIVGSKLQSCHKPDVDNCRQQITILS